MTLNCWSTNLRENIEGIHTFSDQMQMYILIFCLTLSYCIWFLYCIVNVKFQVYCNQFNYRQDAAKRQTAGIVFTHRPKIRFFAPQGRLVAPIRVNFAEPTGNWVRLAVQNLTSIGAEGWECGPQNVKNFQFLVKSRPAGATPLTDFDNF